MCVYVLHMCTDLESTNPALLLSSALQPLAGLPPAPRALQLMAHPSVGPIASIVFSFVIVPFFYFCTIFPFCICIIFSVAFPYPCIICRHLTVGNTQRKANAHCLPDSVLFSCNSVSRLLCFIGVFYSRFGYIHLVG